jgi:hypothetical protein
MHSEIPEAFERDMACTEAEWLRWLPDAIGRHAWDRAAHTATVRIGEGLLYLGWSSGEPRVIALVRLPWLHVSFRFEGLGEDERRAFMRRFDLYMQRGGG